MSYLAVSCIDTLMEDLQCGEIIGSSEEPRPNCKDIQRSTNYQVRSSWLLA